MLFGCIISIGILVKKCTYIRRKSMKHRAATAFSSRMIVGCIASVAIGSKLDAYFKTTPWIMFAMLVYVIVGSLYLLIKESRDIVGK